MASLFAGAPAEHTEVTRVHEFEAELISTCPTEIHCFTCKGASEGSKEPPGGRHQHIPCQCYIHGLSFSISSLPQSWPRLDTGRKLPICLPCPHLELPLPLEPDTFLDDDGFLDPRQIEEVTPSQVLFAHPTAVGANRANAVAKDQVKITRLIG